MDVSKLKIGDRVEFAEDTFVQVTNYETDISKQQGTVVNFSIKANDPEINTHVWIELDEPNEHFNCDEWGNAVQFSLFEDGIHDGGTSVNYLKKAKLLLTEEQMIEILKNKKINQCSKEERDQVMDFAFGSDFMESDNKGEKVKITNKPEVKFLVTWNEEEYSDTKPRIVTMSEFVDDGIGGNWNIEEDGEDTDLGFTIENLKNLKVGETHTVYSPFGWDIKISKESE